MFFQPARKRRNHFRRAQVSRYQNRPYQNPYFSQIRPQSIFPFVIAGLSLGILIAFMSFVFTTPSLRLETIQIEGVKTAGEEQVRTSVEQYLSSARWLFFHPSHRFFFQEEVLRKKLESQFSFERLDIRLEPPTVLIIISEKIPVALWMTGTHSYFTDAKGIVIREISEEEQKNVLEPPIPYGPVKEGETFPPLTSPFWIFEEKSGKDVGIGTSIMSKEDMDDIRFFLEHVSALTIHVRRFDLDRRIGTWMKAVTENGYDILFDPSQDVQNQVTHLETVLREQISDPSVLQYIDVRFDDHVYYK